MSDDLIEELKSLLAAEANKNLVELSVEKDKSSPPSPAKRRSQEGPESPFTVYIDDNYHYQDEDERYLGGEFGTWEAAAAFARKIVDRFLPASEEIESPEEAYDNYLMFSEEPWITGRGPVPVGKSSAA